MPDDGGGPSTRPRLSVTISLDGTLTIEFPNKEWASVFSEFIRGSAYHKDCNPRLRGNNQNNVRLDLPEEMNIHRVQFQGEADHVTFKFYDGKSAKEWYEGAGLWDSPTGAENNKLTLPLSLSQEAFNTRMKVNSTKKPLIIKKSRDEENISYRVEDVARRVRASRT